MTKTYDAVMRIVVPLLIALGMSHTLGMQAQWVGPLHKHNFKTFEALEEGFEGYVLPRPWRPRLFSNYAASLFVAPDPGDTPEQAQQRFGKSVRAWVFFWFFLTSLAYIVCLREKSVFFIAGTFAAVAYGYMPGLGVRIYPWDLPPLFFFTIFTLALHARRFHWLLLIPLATGFKETAVIFAVAFLFWEEVSWRKRWAYLVGVGAAALAVKVGIAVLVDNPVPFLTMSSKGGNRLLENLASFGELGPLHPLFLNAGLLCAFFLLPHRSKEIRNLKLIALLFTAGIFYWANIWEVRVFFEVIPLCLVGVALYTAPGLLEPDRASDPALV